MRWASKHKHNVHVVLLGFPERQHRRCGLTVKKSTIRRIHTHTHTPQARWPRYKGRMSVSLCLNECGQVLGGILLILAATQQDGERPETAPSAHRPLNSPSFPSRALLMSAASQIPQHWSCSVALRVPRNTKKNHTQEMDDNYGGAVFGKKHEEGVVTHPFVTQSLDAGMSKEESPKLKSTVAALLTQDRHSVFSVCRRQRGSV